MNKIEFEIAFLCALCVLCGSPFFPLRTAAASDLDEFKVKREEPPALSAEFAERPVVTRRGDRVDIRFATKGLCDVTLAVEDEAGRILRHLASGVLGPNAPAPFKKDSRAQSIVWDGKDDRGRYLDDKDRLTIRVSLGLAPRFERTLNWSPCRRVSDMPPAMRPTREGVYVYEGRGLDHLRLFDHQGDYVRTLYPFPRQDLERVKGLKWFDFPQGDRLPWKGGSYQQTLLTSGDNADRDGMAGAAATAMAVSDDGRIALLQHALNRLSTAGGTGERDLLGPIDVTFPYVTFGANADHKQRLASPTSAAFSPDGRWLYLAGYAWRTVWTFDILHGVVRIPYEGEGQVEVFAGSMKQRQSGSAVGEFDGPTSVACDRAGRVYVSDLSNDRIQVFSPEGALLKTIPASKPAQVEIHPRTQEIYVFSWPVYTRALARSESVIEPTLTRYGPFESPDRIVTYPLPLPTYRGRHNEWWDRPPLMYRGAVDGWTDPPTIWIAGGVEREPLPWNQYNIRLLREKDGKLEVVKDFGQEVIRASGRPRFAPFNYQMQRLTVNPKTGRLYLAEPDSGPANKAYKQLVEFDPETGAPRLVDLPFNCEDLCFDNEGRALLRTTDVVVRYDPETWKEVPWDYGARLTSVTCGMFGRSAPAVAGLVLPSTSPVCFHQGGMAVSPRGHLAVSCAYRSRAEPRRGEEDLPRHAGKYEPRMYPGRVMSSTGACLHVWDEFGKVLYEDAVPGMPQVDGIGIDRDDNLYLMAVPTRILDGQRYFNPCSETLMKVEPGRARFVSTWDQAPIPLSKEASPERPMDLAGQQFGSGWVEGVPHVAPPPSGTLSLPGRGQGEGWTPSDPSGRAPQTSPYPKGLPGGERDSSHPGPGVPHPKGGAEWMYGGVGFGAFNVGNCACWHSRFTLDEFARSFAPEVDQYRVAVLDTNGNLILRIGQYGNVDDGVPLRKAGGPAAPRSIGGDEVALFYAAYVATHTDRRLFIADIGNGRIASVRLDYHTNERVALKDVPEGGSSAPAPRPRDDQ